MTSFGLSELTCLTWFGWLRRRFSAMTGNDAGFTLLEAVVSFVLFAIVSGASITAIVEASKTNNTSHNRVTAANLAQQDLQQVRAIADRTTLNSLSGHKVTVGSTTYTITRVVPSDCPVINTGTGTVDIDVTTTVSWNGATNPVVMATELSC